MILYFYAPKSIYALRTAILCCYIDDVLGSILSMCWNFFITMTYANVIYVLCNSLAYKNVSLYSTNGPYTLCKLTKTGHAVVLHRIIHQPFTCLVCMATYVYFLLVFLIYILRHRSVGGWWYSLSRKPWTSLFYQVNIINASYLWHGWGEH